MMESGEKYCSNTIRPCDEKNEDEDEEKNESLEMKDGGSSSNSTVEENEKKPSVRPYVRSKMPRLRWTPELHLRFMHAVERLGGQDRATPKLVLQLMDIKGLNIAHVKSHLQMYRTKKIDESNQGLKDHRIFMEGVDRNVYNLSQLPLLPSFNQRQNSNIVMRYGDASWKGDAQWMHNSAIGLNTRNITRPGFYASERMLGSHYSRSSANLDLRSRISSFNEGPIRRSTDEILKEEYGLLKKHEPWVGQFRQNPTEINSLKLQIKQKVDEKRSPNNAAVLGQIMSSGIKRKASDPEVDLNLSLGLESRNGEQNCTLLEDEEDEDEDLVLSLKTTSSSTSKQAKKQKEDNVFSNEKGRGASTLDLTL